MLQRREVSSEMRATMSSFIITSLTKRRVGKIKGASPCWIMIFLCNRFLCQFSFHIRLFRWERGIGRRCAGLVLLFLLVSRGSKGHPGAPLPAAGLLWIVYGNGRIKEPTIPCWTIMFCCPKMEGVHRFDLSSSVHSSLVWLLSTIFTCLMNQYGRPHPDHWYTSDAHAVGRNGEARFHQTWRSASSLIFTTTAWLRTVVKDVSF